jgi:hypothetical protein
MSLSVRFGDRSKAANARGVNAPSFSMTLEVRHSSAPLASMPQSPSVSLPANVSILVKKSEMAWSPAFPKNRGRRTATTEDDGRQRRANGKRQDEAKLLRLNWGQVRGQVQYLPDC